MQPLRPYLSNNSWAARGILLAPVTAITASTLTDSMHLHSLHQQSKNETTLIPESSSKNGSSANPVFRQTIPSEALASRPALPNQTSRSIDVAQGQNLYSSEATVVKEPIIHDIFENKTGSWQYIVADPSTLTAIIIDPVLDYDVTTGTIFTQTADFLLSVVESNGYKIDMILETHAHADHMTAASYLQNHLAQVQSHKPLIGIGGRIVDVQKMFSEKYKVPAEEYEGAFDKLFDDDETFHIGALSATAIHLPGHTPDHMGYKIGDNIFVGDSIFNADLGSARADFPGGSAENLFSSGRRILESPEHVKVWVGHDYPPDERNAPVPWMSVRHHKEQNKHLKDGITEQEFVALRQQRDAMLGEPKLLHQSLQMNIRGGRLPKATDSGYRMLHLPLKLKSAAW